jgi:hypothetical protein
VLEDELCVTPRQVAYAIIVLNGIVCSTIMHLGQLLSEQRGKGILFCKLTHLRCYKLKEDLKVPACYFSRFVNFFAKLLEQGANVALKELWLVCF